MPDYLLDREVFESLGLDEQRVILASVLISGILTLSLLAVI